MNKAINEGNQHYEWVYRDFKGDEFPCEVKLVRHPTMGKSVVRANIVDVSHRRAAELLIQEKSKEIEDLNVNLEKKVQERTAHIQRQKDLIEKAIHDRNDLQKQLIQSEKMASLGQLIASVAHEVNSPLGAISASVDNIIETVPLIINELPFLVEKLNKVDMNSFMDLVHRAVNSKSILSVKEERVLKKVMKLGFKRRRCVKFKRGVRCVN